MPKINIPVLVRPIDLADYAPELAGGTVHVWVNPTRDVVEERRKIFAEIGELLKVEAEQRDDAWSARDDELGQRSVAWYARVWSQHPDPETHWTPEEVNALSEHETDPGLYRWLIARTIALMEDHRQGNLKK